MSCDFLLASAHCVWLQWSAALPSCQLFLSCVIWLLWSWRKKTLIECGVAPSRHSFQRFQRYLRTTKREDAEAKALQCLGEGAGAEEKGELKFFGFFFSLLFFFPHKGHKGDLNFVRPLPVLQILYGHIFSVWASKISLPCSWSRGCLHYSFTHSCLWVHNFSTQDVCWS